MPFKIVRLLRARTNEHKKPNVVFIFPGSFFFFPSDVTLCEVLRSFARKMGYWEMPPAYVDFSEHSGSKCFEIGLVMYDRKRTDNLNNKITCRVLKKYPIQKLNKSYSFCLLVSVFVQFFTLTNVKIYA